MQECWLGCWEFPWLSESNRATRSRADICSWERLTIVCYHRVTVHGYSTCSAYMLEIPYLQDMINKSCLCIRLTCLTCVGMGNYSVSKQEKKTGQITWERNVVMQITRFQVACCDAMTADPCTANLTDCLWRTWRSQWWCYQETRQRLVKISTSTCRTPTINISIASGLRHLLKRSPDLCDANDVLKLK